MRLIDVDALKDLEEMEYIYFMSPWGVPFYEADKVWEVIENAPTIEAEPVRHGRWKLLNDGNGICSECKCRTVAVWDFDNSLRYCPHCGATMDKGD